jgi:large subunit ribosomal protein L29
MKAREIREMTEEEILNALEDQYEAMYHFRFQKASGQLEDSNAPGRTRRDIARLKTILRQKQLAHELAAKEDKNG